jgi:transposase
MSKKRKHSELIAYNSQPVDDEALGSKRLRYGVDVVRFLRSQIAPAAPPRIRQPTVHRKPRYSVWQKVKVIEQRFGEVGSAQSTGVPVSQIARKYNLGMRGAYSIIQRYLERGCVLLTGQGDHQPRKRKCLTAAQIAQVCSKDWLAEQANLSLGMRCRRIQETLGAVVSRWTLSHYYRANGIRNLKPQWAKPNRYSEYDLKKLRLNFVLNLVQYLIEGREVVYFDETTTNLWEQKHRIWMPVKDRIKVIVPQDRGSSVTVLGAISNKRPKLFHRLGHNTSEETVMEFFTAMAPELDEDAVIVMDNHAAHHAIRVKEYLRAKGLSALYLPLQCSDLNPIEKVWHQLKTLWASALYASKGRMTEAEAHAQLPRILDGIAAATITSLARNDCALMLETVLVPPTPPPQKPQNPK